MRLEELAIKYGAGKISDRSLHYVQDVYPRYLEHRRSEHLTVLEIGIAEAKSLQMWREYLPCARIVGIDIKPKSVKVATDLGFEAYLGDQKDLTFLRKTKELLPRVDVIIDDAGHRCIIQQQCFETLWPTLNPDGLYMIEDLWTSYKRSQILDSTVDYMKMMADTVVMGPPNSWPVAKMPDLEVTRAKFSAVQSIKFLHFYKHMIVLGKA